MALPNARQNVVGCQVTSSDLGLTVASTANFVTANSNTIVDDCPRSIFVLATIASGTLVLNGKVASSTISDASSSPTATYTLSASSPSGFIKFDTTAANLSWAIKPVSTGALITQFVVLDLGRLTAGEDSISVGAGQLSFESAVAGDGSGVWSINV